MRATTISKVKKGEYFTFKPTDDPTESQFYIREEYYRSLKKYMYSKFTNVSHSGFAKPDRIFYVDFFF